MIAKEDLINQIQQYSKEFDTTKALAAVSEDLKPVKKILAMLIYNRLDGTKEISLVTEPELHLKYKFNKR